MARVLAVQGAAVARWGDSKNAADLYMRAAQSAAAQGDVDLARPWLHKALLLNHNSALRRVAQQTLPELGNSESGSVAH